MNTDKITAEEMVIIDRLKQMKMSGMAEAYEEQLLNPNIDLTSFFTRFSNIVNFEWELRFNKKFNRFLKKATLRYPQASFDDTIYEPDRQLDTATIEQLATCKWLDEGRNLLITGATGAGKSYLSNALCVAAIRQFKTVKYIRANTMMSEMDQARIKGTYLEYVNHMARSRCHRCHHCPVLTVCRPVYSCLDYIPLIWSIIVYAVVIVLENPTVR